MGIKFVGFKIWNLASNLISRMLYASGVIEILSLSVQLQPFSSLIEEGSCKTPLLKENLARVLMMVLVCQLKHVRKALSALIDVKRRRLALARHVRESMHQF